MEESYGKYVCKYLREIRVDIAKLNGIDYAPAECDHQGECSGHCPACDAEVKALYDKLKELKQNGVVIKFPRFKNLCKDAGIPPEEFYTAQRRTTGKIHGFRLSGVIHGLLDEDDDEL